MIDEHDIVVLTQDAADAGLETGDVGTVVHVHKGGAGCEVEIMTLVRRNGGCRTAAACASPFDPAP